MSFFNLLDDLPAKAQLKILPTILPQIFGRLDKYDLKNVRLVNKRFKKWASMYLFTSVVVAARSEVLEALRKITESPYRVHVKELKYDESAYRESLAADQAEYVQAFQDNADMSGFSFDIRMWASLLPDGCSALVGDAMTLVKYGTFERYQECFQDQMDATDTYGSLGSLLLKLPNIERITWSNRYMPLPVERTTKGLNRFILGPAAYNTCDHESGYVDNGECFECWMAYVIIRDKHKKLKQLSIGDRGRDGLSLGPCHHALSELSKSINGTPRAYSELQAFNLSISVVYEEHPDCVPFQTFKSGALSSILKRMPKLKRFDLHLGYHTVKNIFKLFGMGCYNGTPILPVIIGNPMWPELEDLTLDNVCAHAKELVDLLSPHTKTLKRLRLVDIRLYSGTWEAVASYVRDSTSVRSFELANAYEANSYKEGNIPFSCRLQICSDGTRELVGDNVPKFVGDNAPIGRTTVRPKTQARGCTRARK